MTRAVRASRRDLLAPSPSCSSKISSLSESRVDIILLIPSAGALSPLSFSPSLTANPCPHRSERSEAEDMSAQLPGFSRPRPLRAQKDKSMSCHSAACCTITD